MPAGYRTSRQTNANNFVAANGQIKIPTYYAAKPSSGGVGGVFPQFFYNLEKSSYGIDIGIWFDGYSWRFFAYGENAVVNNWAEGPIPTTLSPNDTIFMAAYLGSSNQMVLRVTKGGTAYTFSVNITSAAYSAFASGALLRREMNLVPQPPHNYLCSYLPSNAYFINAEWYNTTLTTTGGSYVALTTTNSTTVINKDNDGEHDVVAYTSSMVSSMEGGFAKDICTIDFTQRPANICR